MRKFRICLFFIFLGTFCFAQSNNDAQRIVGTWSNRDFTYTFNFDGTFLMQYAGATNDRGNYIINNSKLILAYNSGSGGIYEFYIFPNGRILVFDDRRYDKQ